MTNKDKWYLALILSLVFIIVTLCVSSYQDRKREQRGTKIIALNQEYQIGPTLYKDFSFDALLSDGYPLKVKIIYGDDYPMDDIKRMKITTFIRNALSSPETIGK